MLHKSSQYDKLVDSLYDLALHPENFDSFTHAWEEYLRVQQGQNPGNNTELPEQLTHHFDRTFQILEKIGREQKTESRSPREFINNRDNPSMIVDKQGRLIAINDRARALLQPAFETVFAEDLLHTDSAELFNGSLHKVNDSTTPLPVLTLLPSRTPALILLHAVSDSDDIIVDIAGSSWDKRVHKTLKSMYRLTERECEIAALLYQGLSLNEIADSESRALETVRKHTKSLLNKTQTHSQTKLMRLLTSMNFAQAGDNQPHWMNTQCANYSLTLPDGRALAYYDSEKKSSRVIVVLHGVLHDPELPEHLHQSLLDAGYRIIGVSRAWFGESSPPAKTNNLLEDNAKDINDLLDHLKIKKVTLLATMAGSIHAMVTASLYPVRIERIMHIAAMVPITSDAQIKAMPKSARALFRTAKYFPKLLPVLIRTAVSVIDNGDVRQLFNSAYRNSPIDYAASQRDDVFHRLARGYSFAARHGHNAYTHEGIAVVQNTHKYIAKLKCNNHFIHGAHDGINSIEGVANFCSKYDNSSLTVVEDAGHLLMYTNPQTVTQELVARLQENQN